MANLLRTIARGIMKESLRKGNVPRPSKHVSRLYKETRGTEFIPQGKHMIERIIPKEEMIYQINKKGVKK